VANQTTPSPTTEAGIAFAAWVADRRTLTPEELADILAQLQPPAEVAPATPTPPVTTPAAGPAAAPQATITLPIQQWAGPQGSFATLSPSILPADIAPTTAFGQEFQAWVTKRDALTAAQIADLTAQIATLTQNLAAVKVAAATPTVAPALIIARTPYPKWWNALLTAPISLATAGTQIIVATPGKFTLFIASIVLVVSDETNISFGFGVFGSSGAMLLGGGTQPSGMVIAMGDSPAPCGKSGFTITSDGVDVAVGGFVTYYLETET